MKVSVKIPKTDNIPHINKEKLDELNNLRRKGIYGELNHPLR